MKTRKIRIGQPYKRILVDANIVRCKHPNKSYDNDLAHYKQGHIDTLGLDSWNKLYDDFDNLPEIKEGDFILSGRNDKNGGEIAQKLIPLNARWKESNALIINDHVFYRVDLIDELPKNVVVENVVDSSSIVFDAKRTIKFKDLKNNKFTVNLELKNNERFSMTADGNGSLGQCHDLINPKNEEQKMLLDIWNKWHLNDMNAGTEEQEKELKSPEFEEFKKNYALNTDPHIKWARNLKEQFSSFENYLKSVERYYKTETGFTYRTADKMDYDNMSNPRNTKYWGKLKRNNILAKKWVETKLSSELDHYEWSVMYLKHIGMYEVEHPEKQEMFKYGHGWLTRQLPENFWNDLMTLCNTIETLEQESNTSASVVELVNNDEWDQLSDYNDQHIALGYHLNLTVEELDDIELSDYGYGNNVHFEVHGTEYYCGTESEITNAVKEYIEQTLWAFNSSFLTKYTSDNIGDDVISILQEQCESGNDGILELVNWNNNQNEITEDAIKSDGWAHFLNGYDGKGSEETINNETYLICRT